jgi:hypothetical protein
VLGDALSAPMPIQFVPPKEFTFRSTGVDELALKFQRTRDKKLRAQITALNRLLDTMDERHSNGGAPLRGRTHVTLVLSM